MCNSPRFQCSENAVKSRKRIENKQDPKGPRAEDGGLAHESELAEDLERSLLEDVVGEGEADETGDVAAQRRIGVTEKLFQYVPVSGLCE